MFWALVLSAVLQQPVTVPGPITKVPRADSENLCDVSESLRQLQAGTSYDLVVFVDGSLTYQVLQIFEHALFGPTGTYGMAIDSSAPVCPIGTTNAGKRPHVVPTGAMVPGQFRLEAVVFNNPGEDGVIINSVWVVVQ